MSTSTSAPAPHALKGDRRSTALAVALLLLGVLAHLPAAWAGFTLDDREFVQTNSSVTSLAQAMHDLVGPFPASDPARGLFRPITTLSYALDRELLGPAPQGMHVTNIALYALVALAVLAISRRYTSSFGAATVAALLFCLHPVHCEVVDSITGRSELLALLLSLLSLEALARAVDPEATRASAWIALSTLSFALAAGSKETAVLLPLVLGAHVWLFVDRRRLLVLAPHLLLLPAYVALRQAALGGRLTPVDAIMAGEGLGTRLWTIGRLLAEYARLLVAPLLLAPDPYYERVIGVQHAASLPALAGLALLLALAAVAWRALQARDLQARRMLMSLVLAAVFFAPVSHLVPFGALMAERFLFSPSLGLILLVVIAGTPLAERVVEARPALRPVLLATLLGLLTALSVRTWTRALDWTDSVTLWSPLTEVLADDYRVWTHVGAGYIERGQPDLALQPLQQALALKPDHVPALNNLGLVQLKLKRFADARRTFERVLQLDEDNTTAWNDLGLVHMEQLRHSLARDCFEHSLKLDPHNAIAQANLEAVAEAIARARTWLAENPAAPGQPMPAATLQTRLAACTVVGDDACVAAALAQLGGQGVGEP